MWWIQSVYIKPEFRRQGFFKQLYNHVKAEASAVQAGKLLAIMASTLFDLDVAPFKLGKFKLAFFVLSSIAPYLRKVSCV